MSSSEGDAFDDDSFDNDQYQGQGPEEETVLVYHLHSDRQQPLVEALEGQQLKLLGEDLLQDTIGIGSAMAMAGRVERVQRLTQVPVARHVFSIIRGVLYSYPFHVLNSCVQIYTHRVIGQLEVQVLEFNNFHAMTQVIT